MDWNWYFFELGAAIYGHMIGFITDDELDERRRQLDLVRGA